MGVTPTGQIYNCVPGGVGCTGCQAAVAVGVHTPDLLFAPSQRRHWVPELPPRAGELARVWRDSDSSGEVRGRATGGAEACGAGARSALQSDRPDHALQGKGGKLPANIHQLLRLPSQQL